MERVHWPKDRGMIPETNVGRNSPGGSKTFRAMAMIPVFDSERSSEVDAASLKEGSHEDGTCNPCVFWSSGRGCFEDECNFCHLEHADFADTGRPRRAKREGLKVRITEIFLIPDAEERHRLLQVEASKHPFARNYIIAFLERPRFEVCRLGRDVLVSL